MELWTIQIARWRVARDAGVLMVDTTVKSGGATPFAPTWDMVMEHKAGTITNEEYTERYLALMRDRYRLDPTYWLRFVQQSRVAIACYCPCECFCHRHLLVQILRAVCSHHQIPFEHRGEMT